MAYRLGAGQSIPAEVRRIILEEIDSAIKQLSKNKDKDRDERIHEARKSIKKLRGVLRLITPLIGKETYRTENQGLRDIGRKLSELRDARAVIEIFEAVVEETKPQEVLADELVSSIRGRLEANKAETEQTVNIEETLSTAITALQAIREHVDDYQLGTGGFESLERGLKSIYRSGRKAMAQAEKVSTPEDFHNWRKRVKDHWYHIRLLGDLNTAFINIRENDLKKLEMWLGDDHNLVVLCETVEKDRASFGHPKQIRHFLAIMKQHGKELRAKSMALGEQLYMLKPKQLLREFTIARQIWPAGSEDMRTTSDQVNTPSNIVKKLKKKVISVPSQRSRVKARA